MPVTSTSLVKQMVETFNKRSNRATSFESFIRSHEVIFQQEWELPAYLFNINVLQAAEEVGEKAPYYQALFDEWTALDRQGFE